MRHFPRGAQNRATNTVVYTCTHIHVHAHTCTHTHARTHMHTHMHACTRTCMHAHTQDIVGYVNMVCGGFLGNLSLVIQSCYDMFVRRHLMRSYCTYYMLYT